MPITYFGSASSPADNGSATTSPRAVTPPASMVAGDLVVMYPRTKSGSTNLFTISQASGQTWTELPEFLGSGLFWCRFNGTWGADPSIACSTVTQNLTVVMHVFRPSNGANTWASDDINLQQSSYTAPSTPFTVTATGITPANASSVTVAMWGSDDDNTWGSLSGSGWVVTGTAQYRNTGGTDTSMTFAHKIQTTATATGNVSKNQATLGGDAGIWRVWNFYEISAGTTVNTALGTATLTGLAPIIGRQINTALAGVIVTAFAPTVTVDTRVLPAVGVAQLSGFAPVVTAGGPTNVEVNYPTTSGDFSETAANIWGNGVGYGVSNLVLEDGEDGTYEMDFTNSSLHADVVIGWDTTNDGEHYTGFTYGVFASAAASEFAYVDSGTPAASGVASSSGTKIRLRRTSGTIYGEYWDGDSWEIFHTFGSTYSGRLYVKASIPVDGMELQNPQGLNLEEPASGTTVNTALGVLSMAGLSPQANLQINGALGQLTVSGFSPTIGRQINTSLGALTVTGLVPTVSVSNNISVATGLGAASLNGFAPVIARQINMSVGVLALTGFVPTVALSDNKTIALSLGQLSLSGFIPTVAVSDNRSVTADVGQLSLVGFSPSIIVGNIAYPAVGQATLSGFVPQANVSDNISIPTSLGALSVAGYPPVIDSQVGTMQGSLILNGFAPTLSISDHRTVDTGLGQLQVTGFQPTVSATGHFTANTLTGALILEGLEGQAFSSDQIIVNTNSGELLIFAFEPSVNITDHKLANPDTGVLNLEAYEPTVLTPVLVTPSLGELVMEGFEPLAGGGTTIETENGALSLIGFAPEASISDHKELETDTGELVLSGFAPHVQGTVVVETVVIREVQVAGKGGGGGGISVIQGSVVDEEEQIRNRILRDDEEVFSILKKFIECQA